VRKFRQGLRLPNNGLLPTSGVVGGGVVKVHAARGSGITECIAVETCRERTPIAGENPAHQPLTNNQAVVDRIHSRWDRL
jgi:hypothetical protein